MSMNALEWLWSSLGMTRSNLPMPYLPAEPTILQYLAELIYVNKGSGQVTGFGKMVMGVGAYGRIGLKMEEAFSLTELGGMLEGLTLASVDTDLTRQQVKAAIQEEINRVEECLRTHVVVPTAEQVAKVKRGILLG